MAAIKGRKDSKGYVLRTGESQRNDGRYCYAYSTETPRLFRSFVREKRNFKLNMIRDWMRMLPRSLH